MNVSTQIYEKINIQMESFEKINRIKLIIFDESLSEEKRLSKIRGLCYSKNVTNKITLEFVESKILDLFKISHEELNRKSRKYEIVISRQIAHYIAWKYTNFSLDVIGEHFGRKDHATVKNSFDKISNYLEVDKVFKLQYQEFIESFSDNKQEKPDV